MRVDVCLIRRRCLPPGMLVLPGDIFCCHSWYPAEATAIVNILRCRGQPTTKAYSALTVDNAKLGLIYTHAYMRIHEQIFE